MQSIYLKSIILFSAYLTGVTIVQAQNIERIKMQPVKVIYVTDTANSPEEISQKMGKSYGILFTQIRNLQLKPIKTMSIYHTATAPWVFDVAVEVDKEPEQLSGGVRFKTLEGGDAIVVHYKGPYEQVGNAYQQVEDWLSKNNKQKLGPPIEVYLNDPATVQDKSELLTDIYQLIK